MGPKTRWKFELVPNGQRWFLALAAAMDRAGLPPSEMVLAEGILRLRFGRPDDPSLNATISPRSSGDRGYGATRHYLVGYQGRQQLDPNADRILQMLLALLGRHEAHMPRDLSGHAVLASRAGAGEDQLPRLFPFLTVERSERTGPEPGAAGEPISEVLVRTTSRCNQSCPFCSAPQHAEPDPQVLAACFRAVADLLPGAMVSLTGGEPTLRPDFGAQITGLLDLPRISQIQVQTNAVRFAEALAPGDLPVDDRLGFFVSLHALEDGIYDRCTGTRGQLGRAVEGTRRLLSAGHGVTLNCVVNRENLDHLPAMVAALPGTFASAGQPQLHLSVLICPDWNPTALDYLVRYKALTEALLRATRAAEDAGIAVETLLGSSHASLPACMLPASQRRRGSHTYLPKEGETGYEDFSRPYVKAAGCRRCSEREHCLGVPVGYARAFGLDELEPLGDD